MRVVLDTNVLVAAFIARGVCTDVFERVIADHELILSPHILGEFERVMTGKLRFDPKRVERSLALLHRIGRIVEPEPLAEPICRDSDDDAVLALSRSSGAACLVTGDDDLLVLKTFEKTPVIPPRAFLTFEPPKGSA
jgi:putative PIN family toxin of toxin-antitoxin system